MEITPFEQLGVDLQNENQEKVILFRFRVPIKGISDMSVISIDSSNLAKVFEQHLPFQILFFDSEKRVRLLPLNLVAEKESCLIRPVINEKAESLDYIFFRQDFYEQLKRTIENRLRSEIGKF